MPVVVVEIAPADPPPVLARALVDACSAAVNEGKCRLADDSTPTALTAIAIVRWDDAEEHHARVQVGMQRGGEPVWRGRTLDFIDADARVERWRSVGLTIATLAGEIVAGARSEDAGPTSTAGTTGTPLTGSGASERGEPGATAKSPAPSREVPVTPRAPEMPPVPPDRAPPRGAGGPPPRTLWVSAVALVGPGLNDGSVRLGGSLDVGWRPTPLPVFGRLAGGVAVRPTDMYGLAVQWETVLLGLGGIISASALSIEPRLGVSLDFVTASVAEGASKRQDSGNSAGLGLHGGADAVLRAGPIGLVAAFDAWHVRARTDILIRDQPVGSSAADGWTAGLGLRFYVE